MKLQVKAAIRIVAGVLGSGSFLLAIIPEKAVIEAAAEPTDQLQTRKGFVQQYENANIPESLTINGLDINATIKPVGVDENFAFEVPSAEFVGWYKFGSYPGSQGSTVLAAHVDYAGKEGVFFNLSDLLPGDPLTVEAGNKILRYEVTSVTSYDKESLPIDDLFTKNGPETLQLITCDGDFDQQMRSYKNNLVVTARPIAI